MSKESKPWEIPIIYNEDRPTPGPRQQTPQAESSEDEFELDDEPTTDPASDVDYPLSSGEFASLDDEPIDYRRGDPNQEFGTDD